MQGAAIAKLVTSVTGKWAKVRKAEEREESRRWRRRERMHTYRTSLRTIVFAEMEQAIADASGGRGIVFPKRNLFYSVRHLVQKDPEADRELRWQYFQGLVDDYENEYGEIAKMYRDPRGFLYEPHTGKTVPLGTLEVDEYKVPDLLFDKLPYIEKKGFLPMFKEFKLAEKYDMAIACAEGYATRAAKTLMARAESSHVDLLVLHDADPDGYMIVECLERATRACGFGVNVIDLGLHLSDALAMGLEPEKFYRKKRLSGRVAKEFADRRRVELNDLAKDPDQFIAWVEGKLKEHGLASKLIPPDKTIEEFGAQTRDTKLQAAAREHIEAMIDIGSLIADLTSGFKDKIRLKGLPARLAKWGKEMKPDPWRKEVEALVGERVGKIDEKLEKAAHKAVREAVLSKNGDQRG